MDEFHYNTILQDILLKGAAGGFTQQRLVFLVSHHPAWLWHWIFIRAQ